jgi:hypothetical protein
MMKWKGCGRKHSWPNLRYNLGSFLEELKKITKTCQKSRFPGQYLNRDLQNTKQVEYPEVSGTMFTSSSTKNLSIGSKFLRKTYGHGDEGYFFLIKMSYILNKGHGVE